MSREQGDTKFHLGSTKIYFGEHQENNSGSREKRVKFRREPGVGDAPLRGLIVGSRALMESRALQLYIFTRLLRGDQNFWGGQRGGPVFFSEPKGGTEFFEGQRGGNQIFFLPEGGGDQHSFPKAKGRDQNFFPVGKVGTRMFLHDYEKAITTRCPPPGKI